MTAPDRFSMLASLPPHGAFRRTLALDRSGVPRAVVLAFAPPALTDDPARLAAVLRDVEAAARLHHPAVAAVLGTETVGGELAVVERYRPGATLRALLDAGGRLPRDVAVRIVVDACVALSQAHAIDAGDGRRLVHGALDAAWVVAGEDGAAFVCGFGLAGGGEPAGDLRALGAVLFECLAGEPAPAPPRRLETHGIPAALATAVDRATGAAEPPFESAAAFAAALAAALAPATHASVAAYVDATLPRGEGKGIELQRTLSAALRSGGAEEASKAVIVEPSRALAGPVREVPPVIPPVRTAAPPPPPDAAGTFPKPAPPARPSRAPLAVAAVCLAAGFGIGVGLHRAPAATLRAWRAAISRWTGISAATPTATAIPRPSSAETQVPAPAPAPTQAPPPKRASPPSRKPARKTQLAAPAGKGKLDVTAPEGKGKLEVAAPAGKGKLDVTAPEDAEVFLDARHVGRGRVTIEVVEGTHRIEVRREGATAVEQFTVQPGETWTYTVTPTP